MSKIYTFEWDPTDSNENEFEPKQELKAASRLTGRDALTCTGILALTALAFFAAMKLGRG